jgi:glycosyltransferase involved in cell wall biosynthesis
VKKPETQDQVQPIFPRERFALTFLNIDISSPSFVSKVACPTDGPFAMWLVKAARPRQGVALGLGDGYLYFAACQAVLAADLTTKCLAIDPGRVNQGADLPADGPVQTFQKQNEAYGAFSQLVPKTGPEALGDVADGSVDLLLIDKNHGYADARTALESWTPKLAIPAIVLFPGDLISAAVGEGEMLWADLSQKHETFQIGPPDGLGLVFLGQDLTPEIGKLRALTQTEAGSDAISAVFREAGTVAALDHTLGALAQTAQLGESGLSAFVDDLTFKPDTQFIPLPPGASAAATALRDAHILAKAARADLTSQSDRMDTLLLENMTFRYELAQARDNAYLVWKENLTHKSLLTLSRTSLLPVSPRTRARLAKSAAKRDPQRTLKDMSEATEHALSAFSQFATVAKAAISRGSFINGKIEPDPAKPNVVLVTHEASWTGAPILVHNLAREMSARYNVYVISVKKAVDLMPQLLEVSSGVLLLRDFNITNQVTAFLAKNKFKFAIVNSVESRAVLPAFKAAGIATIALMHEFASNTLPKTAFAEVMEHADFTVFSTRLTLESACEITGHSPTTRIQVFSQGRCEVPATTTSIDVRAKEQAKLEARLRPAGHEDDFLVLGAGTVSVRKGVDLFIEVARQVLAGPQGGKARFVWIGSGYDAERDAGYSIYLLDQLRRAGIEDRVLLLPSTPEIEHAYTLTDAFLLTSRLDPLPNVCIDTMLLGLPILCFDRASGFAEILRQGGMAEDCVGEYLDPADLARRLMGLIADPERYRTVSRRMREIAAEAFEMQRYVLQIENLAEEVLSLRGSFDADAETIVNSAAFDPEHMFPPKLTAPGPAKAAKAYLETYARGPHPRRPEPGFNPQAFAEDNLRETGKFLGQDAYAAFLRAGRPVGRWLTPVLDRSAVARPGATVLRYALHIHAYYIDELPRLLNHLAVNQVRPSLFVSVADGYSRQKAMHFLKDYAGPGEVRLVPNIGRDIGPLLTEFGRELIDGFDVIGHIHTKKSESLASKRVVQEWTRLLFENVLGGKSGGAMADRILQAFEADPNLGLVYPSDPNILGWTRNWPYARDLAERLNLEDLPQAFDFPVGTMFWMRAGALRPFVDLGLEWRDFPREPLGYDGSMLHALERLFGIVPLHHGFHAAVTCINGITR